MPPKGWRKTATGFQPTNSSGVNIKDRKTHGIEELLLPRSVIARIAKQCLPENTPLPRDGVTALMRSVTMFTSYITAEANQIARMDSRKTVTHADICKALETCHFESFVNATKELSEQVVVQQGGDTIRNNDTSIDQEGKDDVREADDEIDDDYIEEDVEPQADAVLTNFSGFSEQKKPRLSTEPNSDAEMHVDG